MLLHLSGDHAMVGMSQRGGHAVSAGSALARLGLSPCRSTCMAECFFNLEGKCQCVHCPEIHAVDTGVALSSEWLLTLQHWEVLSTSVCKGIRCKAACTRLLYGPESACVVLSVHAHANPREPVIVDSQHGMHECTAGGLQLYGDVGISDSRSPSKGSHLTFV